jgi:Xaa-Pro aminopeptidase
VEGYCSDCTRTFATGELPAELQRAYEVCLDAQEAAVDAVRAGANARAVDAVARERISAAGLGDAFGHGLGHGVGLLVHEAPRLSPIAPEDETLAAGNVVTVEPGIYLEGLGGVRIEDLVVVGDDGAEVLTSFPRKLVTIS